MRRKGEKVFEYVNKILKERNLRIGCFVIRFHNCFLKRNREYRESSIAKYDIYNSRLNLWI